MLLIIAKDPEERRRALNEALKSPKGPVTTLDPASFTVDAFSQEVETLPFLSKEKTVVVLEIDKLTNEGIESLKRYVARPSEWVTLMMTATTLHPQSKLLKAVDQQGTVQRFKVEKPWEKERRLADWVAREAAESGIHLTHQVAQAFVQAVDPSLLKGELDKLICYVGERKMITLDDIHVISTPMHHETLWQLGDALFERETAAALRTGQILLEDGMAVFPLLANLRTQMQTAKRVLSLYREGGRAAVTQAYAYLKGGLLDKKLKLFDGYGEKRLNSALLSIYATEIEARNSTTSPHLLLELLIAKLG